MDYSQLGNKKRKREPHTMRVRNKIGLLFFRVTLSLLLVGIFAGAGAGIGVYLGILDGAPELDISSLGPISPRAIDPHTVGGASIQDGFELSSFIVCARTGEVRETLHRGMNREFVSIDEMPRHLIYAFIAIEDERFFEHNGIDTRGIARAVWVATQPARQTEGASTITQQLIKNMLEIDNDIITKLQEQHLAVGFERHLTEEFARLGYEDPHMQTKYFIMQSYLNMINLGRSNYGVQAAAQFYFGIDVSELTIAQSAVIAAITQNPSRFPPDTRPDQNWIRAQLVLFNMYERLGLITTEEYEEAIRTGPRQAINSFTGEPMYDDGEPVMLGIVYDTIYLTADGEVRDIIAQFDCFTSALLSQVRVDLIEQLGLTGAEADRRIFETGLTINSVQDVQIQEIVDRHFLDESLWPGVGQGFSIEVRYSMVVYNAITQLPRSYTFPPVIVPNVAEAAVFVERMHEQHLHHADEIVSYRLFKVPQPQGAFVLIDHHTGHVLAIRGVRGELQGNRALNRATQSTRSPGSQMKPLVPFAPAFELGMMQPSTIVDDIPMYLPAAGGRGWLPRNHWDGGRVFRGHTTVRNAIYASGNVVSARAATDPTVRPAPVGMPTMVRYLELMGISTIHPHDGPAIVLGGMTRGVYLIELAGAYATVANAGEFNRPVLYTTVLDHEGNILLENQHNPQRVLRDTTAYLLTSTMADTLTRGTGGRANWTPASGLRGQMGVAGKTGTSQNNADLGFAGYTPYFTAAIWFGNDNNQPMHRGTNQFHTPLWRVIMEEIHLTLELPPQRFTRPAGIVSAQVCLDSGHLPNEFCRTDPRGDRIRGEIFATGLVPSQVCRVHQQFTYCTETGFLAGANCPYYQTRVGIVRAQSVDHLEEMMREHRFSIRDRQFEFPAGVREGFVCSCAGLDFGEWQNPADEWQNPVNQWHHPVIYDPATGLFIPDPNATPPPSPTPTPPPQTVELPGVPGGFGGFNSPAATMPPPSPTPSPPAAWPGLGRPSADATPENTSSPFVNTIAIPGLE
ncbi:MAG: transglycosylase domain-containing protein [Defluviitaleaceae bacterium]|nr:transglycosylase domain-containing protein [Defluviitaleaceae bacterium]